MAWFRRRQYIVMGSFQWCFVLFQIILVVALALFLWLLVFYPLQVDMTAAAVCGLRVLIPPHAWLRVLMGLVIVFVTMAALALSESHRIAGPIFRLQKTLKALIAGDFPQQVTLRKGDDFRQLETVINELAARFETASRAAQRIRESLAPGLDELAALCSRYGAPEPVCARVEALRAQVAQALGASA